MGYWRREEGIKQKIYPFAHTPLPTLVACPHRSLAPTRQIHPPWFPLLLCSPAPHEISPFPLQPGLQQRLANLCLTDLCLASPVIPDLFNQFHGLHFLFQILTTSTKLPPQFKFSHKNACWFLCTNLIDSIHFSIQCF